MSGYQAPLLDGDSISPADVDWDKQDYTRYDDSGEALPYDSAVLMLNDALKNEVGIKISCAFSNSCHRSQTRFYYKQPNGRAGCPCELRTAAQLTASYHRDHMAHGKRKRTKESVDPK